MRIALLTNGPGELQGWARPLAAELARRGHSVTLWILPCQYASGRERAIAGSMSVDAVIGPLPFPATLREMSRRPADVVVQLGGDLLFGRFLSRRHGVRFLCYAYGPKSGMKWCDMVSTAFPHMAEKLRKRHPRVFLTGDLVRDAVGMRDAAERTDCGKRDAEMRIIVFPGSRKGIRDASLPFVKDVFRDVRKEFPDVAVRTLLFPFAEREEYARWNDAGLEPTDAPSAEAMDWADLAVTQPGTNTLELMHRRRAVFVHSPHSRIGGPERPAVSSGRRASREVVAPEEKARRVLFLLAEPRRGQGRRAGNDRGRNPGGCRRRTVFPDPGTGTAERDSFRTCATFGARRESGFGIAGGLH